MRLPKKITISGHELNIKYADGLVEDGIECLGIYKEKEKTIYLKKGMGKVRKREVFIHEYMHFLEDIYGILISEESINNVSSGMVQLLLNPKINIF